MGIEWHVRVSEPGSCGKGARLKAIGGEPDEEHAGGANGQEIA